MKLRNSITPLSLLLSIAFHLLFVYGALEKLASLPQLKVTLDDEPILAELVELVPENPPAREIAPPSQAKETKTPPPQAKLGERNTETEKESIRRGSEEGPQGNRNEEKTSPAPVKPTQDTKSAEPKSSHRTQDKSPAEKAPPKQSELKNPILRLGANDLLAKLGPGTLEPSGGERENDASSDTERKNEGPSDAERSSRFFSVQPFRRSGAGILQPGVSDLLNNVPDGEITVLNEKADQFAVFVRRVANQVFGALRRTSWAKLSALEVEAIRKFGRVRAVLSPRGKLIRVEVLDGSGSSAFDELLNDSVEIGANDQNPPKEALAPDGNFRFIFIARTWTRRAPNNVSEQRWIVLGTGLE